VTEVQLLFLVLAVIYGWECACWLRRGSVGARTWWGNRWRLAHPGETLGNQHGGIVFAHPLPPLGWLFVSHQFPLSLSPEAVLAYVAPAVNPGWRPLQTGRCVRFADMRDISARGRRVLVNGEVLLKAASPTFAAGLVEQLRQLKALDPAQREAAIRQNLRATLDVSALQQRWQEFRQPAGKVRLVTNLLFGYLFVLAPVLIWLLGFRLCWLGLLVGLLALTTSTAVLFHRVHKRFYPAAEDDRFTHTFITLLSPATTIRAHDVLSRPLFETFHPLALARVLCSEPEFRTYARAWWRQIAFPSLPACPRPEAVAQAAEAHWRGVLQEAMEKFLNQSGLNRDALAQPPAPLDGTSRSYCPRCLAQFTVASGDCPDCGGLPLADFPPARPGV
jgi:hypothetical protein